MEGKRLMNSSRYEEALVFYNQALQKDPMFVNALINKGVALAELGRSKEQSK